jgi:hypothetical protein
MIGAPVGTWAYITALFLTAEIDTQGAVLKEGDNGEFDIRRCDDGGSPHASFDDDVLACALTCTTFRDLIFPRFPLLPMVSSIR